MKDKFLYTDGLTPQQISRRLHLVGKVKWFFENDLTKQDRQTDEHTNKVEFKMYELLGIHPSVLDMWKRVHGVWQFKSNKSVGQSKSQRLTGQATTSLGNVITNLLVHWRFVKRNQNSIKMMLFLGDDNLGMMDQKPDVANLRKDIAVLHNM